VFALSNPCVTLGSSLLMISKSLRAVYAVHYMRHRGSSLLMIYESLGAVCVVKSMRHPWKEFC
jgi:hypothetical protein